MSRNSFIHYQGRGQGSRAARRGKGLTPRQRERAARRLHARASRLIRRDLTKRLAAEK